VISTPSALSRPQSVPMSSPVGPPPPNPFVSPTGYGTSIKTPGSMQTNPISSPTHDRREIPSYLELSLVEPVVDFRSLQDFVTLQTYRKFLFLFSWPDPSLPLPLGSSLPLSPSSLSIPSSPFFH
jgi:hypothetical protein